MRKNIGADWLREKRTRELMHPAEIAALAGVSQKTIERRLREYGIALRIEASDLDRATLQRLYCNRDVSLQSLSHSLGVNQRALADRIVDLGLPLREKYLQKEWLEEQIGYLGRDVSEVADECSTSKKTVYAYLKQFGIPVGKRTELYHDPDWCREQHYAAGKSIRQIAREVGRNPATVAYWFQKHGISVRGEKRAGHRDREDAHYRDEQTLRELLEGRMLSDEEAARELGCNRRNVQYWKAKCQIGSRSHSESTTLRHSRVAAPYKTREWCEEQYVVREKTTYEIGDEANVSPSTIRRWLLRHGIRLRAADESYHLAHRNRLDMTPYLRAVLEGELLGDGSIIRCSQRSASYRHSSKYEEYVQWLSDEFAAEGLEQSGTIRQALCNKGTAHESIVYQYHSLCYPELLQWRNRFYPEGRKIVPPDLRLDPISCRHWYIGDGHLAKRTHQRPFIVLYTCAFDAASLERLRSQLAQCGFRTTLWRSRNQLYLPWEGVRRFLDYIGPCPEPIAGVYGYKWDLG